MNSRKEATRTRSIGPRGRLVHYQRWGGTNSNLQIMLEP